MAEKLRLKLTFIFVPEEKPVIVWLATPSTNKVTLNVFDAFTVALILRSRVLCCVLFAGRGSDTFMVSSTGEGAVKLL